MSNLKVFEWIGLAIIGFFAFIFSESILGFAFYFLVFLFVVGMVYAVISHIVSWISGEEWGMGRWDSSDSSSRANSSSARQMDTYKPPKFKTYNWRCKQCGKVTGYHTDNHDMWPPTSGCPYHTKTHDWRRLE